MKVDYIDKIINKPSLKEMDLTKQFNYGYDWKQQNKSSQPIKEEHLLPWLFFTLKHGITSIPKKAKTLAIFGSIILLVNLIFWTINTYMLPTYLKPFKGLIKAVVYLTATYNDVVPKTIFWVLLFTFGRRLFKQIIRRGPEKTFGCMKNTLPMFMDSITTLKEKALPIITFGIGFGLVVANNFASYSRFSQARNKSDKYFIVLIMAFTISYLLGEANKTGIFKFVKLASKDLSLLVLKKEGLTDEGVFLILSGFILGLLLDAPFIWMKAMYGGYISGLILILIAIGLWFKHNYIKKS
ncbi:MAG: hypothetical protein JXR88_07620 [Clostridia bacterium]|nr:hypothetical protein [Clostridia bacterium]